jgi:uncharacterized membrane protein YczE
LDFFMSKSLVLTRRWVQLLLGLGIYGIAIAMMIRAAVGISPWDVLAQGIALRTGIPFGLVTNIVGGVVLLLWIPLRQRLGVGTILNALLIGPSAEVGLWLIPEQSNIWMQLVLFTGGLILLAIATGLYIGARFGPGPRDGLMTGINKKFGIRIWIVRTSIEVVVLGIGWLLGGNVGFGTLAFALLIGPMVHVTMPLLHVSDKRGPDKRSPGRDGPGSPLTPEPAASPSENR